ncbi:MAG: HAD-IA family hydrolase [Kiritimatiellae bacterium]|nr:HAD-IA family hydrolase [Kiritimatiellia bacterium]
MKQIKGIVFDFGGVISAAHDDTFWAKARAVTGWSREEIWAGWRRHRWMLDADFITPQGLYHLIGKDLGNVPDGKTLDLLAEMDYDSWAVPNPETLQWAKELKAAGYKIGILTNMPTSFIPWFNRAAAAFRQLADAEVISGVEHIVKPDPAIYALMAARLDLPAEQLCFFDDMLPNVEAAKNCGWHAAQFSTVSCAQAALAEMV